MRMEGLLAVLQQPPTNTTHHPQLAAVLLRREILHVTNLSTLQGLVEPLLAQLMTSPPTMIANSIGDCLAEICSSVHFWDADLSVSIVTMILQVRVGIHSLVP